MSISFIKSVTLGVSFEPIPNVELHQHIPYFFVLILLKVVVHYVIQTLSHAYCFTQGLSVVHEKFTLKIVGSTFFGSRTS